MGLPLNANRYLSLIVHNNRKDHNKECRKASCVSYTCFDFVVMRIVFNDWFEPPEVAHNGGKNADTGEAASRRSEPEVFIGDMSALYGAAHKSNKKLMGELLICCLQLTFSATLCNSVPSRLKWSFAPTGQCPTVLPNMWLKRRETAVEDGACAELHDHLSSSVLADLIITEITCWDYEEISVISWPFPINCK